MNSHNDFITMTLQSRIADTRESHRRAFSTPTTQKKKVPTKKLNRHQCPHSVVQLLSRYPRPLAIMLNLRVAVCSLAVVLTIIRSSTILRRTFLDEEGLYGLQFDLPTSSDSQLLDIPRVSSEPRPQDVQSNSTQQHLAGNPRIAYITYSFLATPANFENMIFASLDTWLTDGTYFVVLNQQWKQAYSDLCSTYPQYCQRIQPLYVDCPEGKWGESPCCKQQQGLLQMMDSDAFQHYDWFLFQDDDMYLRRSYLQDFLKPIDTNSPAIATSGGVRTPGRGRQLGQPGFAPVKAREYNCSDERDFTYPWGQPVVYNSAALHRISSGLRQGGLVKQCLEYNVTHDSGNAIFHWMYQLPEVRFRVPFFPKMFNERIMGLHGVAKTEDTLSMEQVHDKLKGFDHPPVESHDWFRVNGFQQTATYKHHGDPATWTEWHTMPTRDCAASKTKQ